ncbi:c-type cytochrome [Lutimaribacter marinistellae]|uniref:C-type cytochrome n=1 Tax=Lutimaribacter marinistellae TaxID=1820329 RepID=A0ABV7TFX1_9RHOB
MKFTIIAAFAATAAAGAAYAEAHASGDAEAGESVYRQCRSCHMIVDADGNDIQKGGKTGPNLYGVFERTAGSVEDFRYSDAMVSAGEAGLAWNEEDFVAYVQDPTGYLREYLDDSSARGKMSYRVRSEEDARDVWAYLVSVGPAPES